MRSNRPPTTIRRINRKATTIFEKVIPVLKKQRKWFFSWDDIRFFFSSAIVLGGSFYGFLLCLLTGAFGGTFVIDFTFSYHLRF